MGRLFRRLAVFTVIGVAAAAVFRRFFGGGECGPACDCSLGEPECRCGHRTCLAPAV